MLAGCLAKVQVLFTHVRFPTGRRHGYDIGHAKAKQKIKKVKERRWLPVSFQNCLSFSIQSWLYFPGKLQFDFNPGRSQLHFLSCVFAAKNKMLLPLKDPIRTVFLPSLFFPFYASLLVPCTVCWVSVLVFQVSK